MLLSKKVWIKSGSINFKYFKNLGYDIEYSKELFEVNIEDLSKGSNVIVDVKCDYCNEILHIPYRRYIKYTTVCEKYACSKIECSNQKIKDVCMIKYGVENPFQANFVKEKSKNTFNKKYGVNHQMKISEVKEKIKKTCLERYGVENPNQCDDVQSKRKNTCLLKYGVDHDNKLDKQKEKRKKTRIKKGMQLPDNLLKPYFLYRRQIDNISDGLKIELLKTWDGFDYYDNEYIKDYFSLNSNDKNYPTLDHKISVIYGFLNNISTDKIASLDNLCFTKNKLNAQKGSLNEHEYKIKNQT